MEQLYDELTKVHSMIISLDDTLKMVLIGLENQNEMFATSVIEMERIVLIEVEEKIKKL